MSDPDPESRRERKKRQTRRHLSDVATRLFTARGFENVTVAEVAREADVAVNTVYNYFPTKEDLCFPAERSAAQRLADIVRERQVGESAARAVLRTLREEVTRRDRALGLTPGFGNWLSMVRAAPTLTARLEWLGEEMTRELALLLAAETHAQPNDQLPALVASQLGWAHAYVLREISERVAAGHSPDPIAEAVLQLLDALEPILGEQVLNYAARSPATGEPAD